MSDREPAADMWREAIAAHQRDAGISIAERAAAERCAHTDHDLFTNRRRRCDKDADHVGIHRLVFAECVHEPIEGKCRHCHDDPPPGHTCPSCGREAS